jgi:hypothetical protein
LALADLYDGFADGFYERDPNDPHYDANIPYWTDPNAWDIDNPDWTILEIVGAEYYYNAINKWLRLWVDSPLIPYGFLAAVPEYGDADPNTSPSFWDDTTSHYVVAKVRNSGWYEDPNDDRSMGLLFIHADINHWWTFWLVYEFGDNWTQRGGWFALAALDGTSDAVITATHIPGYPGEPNYFDPNWSDPNNLWADPNFLNEHDGFWMAMQFKSDGVTGDPNGKWIGAACWDGEKFDWDGNWVLARELDSIDPNEDWWPERYWTSGFSGVASMGLDQFGTPSDVAFDGVECRIGVFTNVSRTLRLRVKTTDYGQVHVDPDLLDDPNNASTNPLIPTDPNELRRYTSGTEVVLVAEALEGRSFKKWKIWDDPNRYPDPNCVDTDSNVLAYLTMDRDYVVEAIFSCSGDSSVLPPAAVVLVTLTLGALLRRML